MPNCPQCGRETPVDATLCAACSDEKARVPVVQAQPVYTHAKVETVDAEIIDENDESRDNYHNHQQGFYGGGQTQGNDTAFGRVHGRSWQQGGAFGQASRELSCLPGMITLILGISLGIQLGFLASLGFFFFYVIASALAVGVSVRRTLMGKPVFIWLNRALVWICAYAIAFNLAV